MSHLSDYLNAWDHIVVQHFYYSQGPTRCSGVDHYVDCSGGVTLALNMAGVPTSCNNSYGFAAMCHQAARPEWMIQKFGPGQGTEITMAQAIATPGAWGFHGNDGGQAPDSSGDGHIKTSVGGGRSVEAMSQRLGVNYSTFDAPGGFINYCALPPMLLDDFNTDIPSQGGARVGMTAGYIVPGSHQQKAGTVWAGRYPNVGAVIQADGSTDLVGFDGAGLNLAGAAGYLGMSILKLGKLNAPIVSACPDGHKGIVFLAGDGGTFAVPSPTVHYL